MSCCLEGRDVSPAAIHHFKSNDNDNDNSDTNNHTDNHTTFTTTNNDDDNNDNNNDNSTNTTINYYSDCITIIIIIIIIIMISRTLDFHPSGKGFDKHIKAFFVFPESIVGEIISRIPI